MFRYETHKKMSLGKSGECTRLVLRATSGEILFLAIELDDTHFIMGKKGDDGFEQLLKSFKLADVSTEETNFDEVSDDK